jgi:hypothetical protein
MSSSWKAVAAWSLSALSCTAAFGCSSSADSAPVAEATSLDVVFSPTGGTFVGAEMVTLSVRSKADIHYTLDGTLPTAASPLYAGPIALSKSTRLLATAMLGATTSSTGGVGGASGTAGGAAGKAGAGGGSAAPEQQGAIVGETYLRVDPNTQAFTSRLPILLIHTFQSGKLDPQATDFVPANLELLEPKSGSTSLVGTAALDTRIGIHVRGATSRGFLKKQYAVELRGEVSDSDRAQPLLGLPSNSDWVLSDPVSMDRTLIRNALAFAISNRIGRYAPRTRFTEVFLVDDGGDVRAESFLGFYTLIEKIKRDPERVDVSKLPASAITMPDVTGGYLLSIDKGASDFQANGENVQFVYPDSQDMKLASRKPQVDFIRTFINSFGAAASAKDFKNPTTGQHYSEFIDVDGWIDHNIVNTLTKNVDALRISAYFHKERGERLVAGPVWDFDRSLGTPYDERAKQPEEWKLMGSDGTDYFNEGWWQALFRDPAFKARYRDRFKALLSNELSADSLDRMVDGLVTEVGDAAPRNFARWTQSPPKDGSYASEIAILKDFLRRRVAWIQTQLDAGF